MSIPTNYEYTIQRGDTLSSIAQKHGINDWQELRAYHNANVPLEDLMGPETNFNNGGKLKYVLIPPQKPQQESILADSIKFQNNKGILIEEGYIFVGSNILKHGGNKKYYITNANGIKSYDWVAGDSPSLEEEERMCSGLSKTRLENIKKWKTSNLEESLSSTLYTLSDTGSDAKKLASHFFNGAGEMFKFDSNTNLSKEIKSSDTYKAFLKNVIEKIKQEMIDGSLKQENKDGTYSILRFTDIVLPSYGFIEALGKNDDAATFIGGVQACILKYQLYKDGNKYIASIKNVFFYDTFGAGWDDACNTGKSYSNGLVAMFILQHYRNIGNTLKYQPFIICVEINY
ncbi:MAG: LysM peptidoglycan-binding domain-containing protein [Moheibacter sp.]